MFLKHAVPNIIGPKFVVRPMLEEQNQLTLRELDGTVRAMVPKRGSVKHKPRLWNTRVAIEDANIRPQVSA